MIQIPDNVRPYLDAVVRFHFWILLGLVPVLVLPMVFVARGRLAAEIDASRGQVESRLSAIKSVEGIQPHPNDAWSGEIDKATQRVKRETFAEWQRFWKAQEPLRVWPESLGPDFVQAVTALRPGGKFPRRFLERYQNGVRSVVRTLPARMGADEQMLQAGAAGVGQPPGPPAGFGEPGMPRGRPGPPDKPVALVQWNPADQQRLYASFNWDRPPAAATQILLAQEELWVYGLIIDAIARTNRSATGPYNAAVPMVEQLAVGYPAAEDNPGGVAGGRIVVPAAPGQANPMGEFGPPPEAAMMDPAAAGGASARPPHPRFAAAPVGPGAGGEVPPDAAASTDDLLRNWIYVDFSGKPLSAAEFAASPDALLVHLMPFIVRAVIDERKLDAFLVELAASPVPIDVRQVRINTSGSVAVGMPPMGPAGGGEFGGQVAPSGNRAHDVMVELRGTVGLATQPNPAALELEAVDGNEEGFAGRVDAEAPAAANPGEPSP